jgi:hypothetical protein
VKIDVLIPMLGRAHFVAPLVRSLIDSTRTPYRLLFLCSPGDEEVIATCRAHGETCVMEWAPEGGDFARKINWAFENTDSEWLFQGASDIRFNPGWDRQALRIAGRSSRGVIGTNDLHNPGVLKKIASTHTLFSRRYIEQFGGTVDGTGRVFCELYDHQFVDTEFIETAKLRHQFAFAQHAIVEHLHHYFGGRPRDEIDDKALRATADDHRLYTKRRAAIRADDPAKRRLRRLEDIRAR